ncbi:type VII secretion system-associated protein [Streptomyces sp. NPDC004838]
MAEPQDPKSETGKLSLDKAGLESFLRERVEPFRTDLKSISEDNEFGLAMAYLSGKLDLSSVQNYGEAHPLRLGMMVNGKYLNNQGVEFNTAVKRTATGLNGIYEDQTKLFQDLEENLRTTIDTLFSTQAGNLVDIDGQDFLDVFEDVESGLSGSQISGGGGGGDEDA